MIKVIAWATDGSPSARRALSVAKDLARAHDARLLVLHVQGTGLTRKGFFNDANPRLVAALDRVAGQLREEGFQAELVVGKIADGDQHRRILELAKEADVDLIVVGNRGHGPSPASFSVASPSACSRPHRCPYCSFLPRRPRLGDRLPLPVLGSLPTPRRCRASAVALLAHAAADATSGVP